MSIAVDAADWDTLDAWWDTYVATQPVTQTTPKTRLLDDRWLSDVWSETVDPWWDGFIRSQSLVTVDDTTARLDQRLTDGAWSSLDPWWDSYSEVRAADVATLQSVLDTLTTIWQESAGRFDADPLATDWTHHTNTRGPLRPNQEENWSQWLAHLLRSGPPAFLDALFDTGLDITATTVEREVHLPASAGPDRYADILVFTPAGNISIEVKKGDEHYGKTTDTAGLIERQYGGDWTHILLLPEHKRPALRHTFEDAFIDDSEPRATIRSDQSNPITVLHWRAVSTAIRTVLLDDVAVSPHWAASGYLFCTLIEQQLLGFNPAPVLDRIARSDDVIHATQSLAVAAGDIDDQIQYLRAVIEAHHE